MRIIIICIGLIILYAYSLKSNNEEMKEGDIPKYIQVDQDLLDVMEDGTLKLGKRPLCFKK